MANQWELGHRLEQKKGKYKERLIWQIWNEGSMHSPVFWAIHFYIKIEETYFFSLWLNGFLISTSKGIFLYIFYLLSILISPNVCLILAQFLKMDFQCPTFVQTPGYNNQSCWYCKCQFPNFCCCSFGQELVVAIADFALETVLVFFASNRLSPTTFLSLANKNTTLQDQHKHN